MKVRAFRSTGVFFILICLSLPLLSGCGGGSNSTPPAQTGTQFWSVDFNTDTIYSLYATQTATGNNCYIYVENGQYVSPTAIEAIKNEFDNVIYPSNRSTFGSEPNPGADGDPKIYILLSKFLEPGGGSYIAGFFDPTNELSVNSYPYSNQKEIFFMNINPLKGITPGDIQFFSVLAHEFQHMIHWEQKTHLKNIDDPLNSDTWLNEAMSEIAPVYCGYGPNQERVTWFESHSTDSLTEWLSQLADYSTVYMWAQYFMDRFTVSPNIFQTMLSNDFIGIESVDAALTSRISGTTTFTSTFKDWSIAVFSGSSITWPGHPEWSMVSVDPFLTVSLNPSSLAIMPAWSMGFYGYTQTTSSPGTVKWSTGSSHEHASFIDQDNTSGSALFAIDPDMVSGATHTFTTYGYLITQNTSTFPTAGGSVTHTAPLVNTSTANVSPKTMLENANKQARLQKSAKPRSICVHSYFTGKDRKLRKQGAQPAF